MAKIALISSGFHSQTNSLAQFLSLQKQDVVVVTKSQDRDLFSDKIRVLTPFQKHSVWEAVRVFAPLIKENFDVFHFLFFGAEQNPRWLI